MIYHTFRSYATTRAGPAGLTTTVCVKRNAPEPHVEASVSSRGGGLHARTVQELGTSILHGHLRPGQVLRSEELERDFDVSRSVIREALRVLAAKGMVDARPKRGTLIRPREHWNLLDPDVLRWHFEDRSDQRFFDNLAELRAIIEPPAARLAAERREPGDLEVLDRELAAMAKAGKRGREFMAADLRFHAALLAASHNELVQRLKPVIEAGLRARDMVVHQRPGWPDSLPVHSRVADAVRAGDGAAAEAAMRSLLQQADHDLRQVTESVDGC